MKYDFIPDSVSEHTNVYDVLKDVYKRQRSIFLESRH